MRAFTIIDAPQRSPEWLQARVGRATGSNACKILAKIKSGEAADRRNYRVQLVLERLTNKPQESGFVTAAMQAGIDREPDAIAAYEAHTSTLLQATGFLAHTDLMAGCSLDGHLGDFETLISIKCRQAPAHYAFLRHGEIPAASVAQMRHELFITGAREHHYVSWNPDFPERQQLHIRVFQRSELEIPEYEQELIRFLAEVDQELKAIDGWHVLKGEAVSA